MARTDVTVRVRASGRKVSRAAVEATERVSQSEERRRRVVVRCVRRQRGWVEGRNVPVTRQPAIVAAVAVRRVVRASGREMVREMAIWRVRGAKVD